MDLPDLSRYRLHRTVRDAEFEGVAVPGLSAQFFRRTAGDRLHSVGRYRFAGRELLMAWGYVDEQHCRYSAVRGTDGAWGRPIRGCPQVRVLRDGDTVVGFEVRDARGCWIGGPATVASTTV